MASFNSVTLVGNLTRDVELKFLQSGTAVTELGMAINNRVKKGEEWIDEPCFVDVTLFGRTAEVAGEYCSKGSNILISGRLKYEQWEKDGQKRNKLKVIGDQLQLLGSRGSKSEAPAEERAAPKAKTNSRPAHETVPPDDIPF